MAMLSAAILLAPAFSTVSAQDSEEPKFKFTPTGRILADGAVYAPRWRWLCRRRCDS